MTGLSPGAQNLSWLSDFRFFIGTYSWQAELRDIRDCRKINDILERRSTEIRKLYEECQDSCKFHFQILFFLQQVCCVFSCKISVQPHTIIMHACFDKWLFWVFTHFTFHTFICTVFYAAFFLLLAARVSFIFLITRSTRHVTLPSLFWWLWRINIVDLRIKSDWSQKNIPYI